ncbi:MAG: hypothetical protein ABSG99_02845 [Sedimentisphaerales bacterium]
MGQPITYEELWGVPEAEAKKYKEPADFCPYKKIRYSIWDGECQMDKYIQETEY